MKLISALKQWNLANKRIVLRADLNVPRKNGTLVNDFKIQAVMPTIDYLLKQKAQIILLTHIGRPTEYDEALSTQLLIPWFTQRGYDIVFSPDIGHAQQQAASIVLLENLRFFPGEQTNDVTFAKQLAQLGYYFVNDAFGMMHRTDTSITLLPQQFSSEKRTIGFLVEKELHELDQLLTNPAKPFVLILGGAKAKTKLPIIEHLLTKIDTLLLCPSIAFTFAKALGKKVGNSLVDENALELCAQIMQKAQEQNVTVLLPLDYQVAQKTIDGTLSFTSDETIPNKYVGISIGPKTIDRFCKEIAPAGTIFFNGALGFLHRKETLNGMKALFQAMASASGKSIIAGGDSVAAAHNLGMTDGIDHLSSGGGATLAYISGQELPGLLALKNGTKT